MQHKLKITKNTLLILSAIAMTLALSLSNVGVELNSETILSDNINFEESFVYQLSQK